MQVRRLLVLLSIGCFVVAAAAPPAAAQDEDKPRSAQDTGAKPKPPEGAKPDGTDAPSDQQEEGKSDDDKKKKKDGLGGLFGSGQFLFIMLGVFVLMYIMMGRGRRKQATRHREMLAALKKGDKVTTRGGIVGTVIELRDNDVTVKVDETNNIRIRFTRWAVLNVGDATKTQKPEGNA